IQLGDPRRAGAALRANRGGPSLRRGGDRDGPRPRRRSRPRPAARRRQGASEVIRINLAPVETRRRRGPGFTMPSLPIGLGLLFAILYVVAVLGVGYAWWSFVADKSRLIAENDRTSKEIDTLKATLGQGANIKTQLIDVRKRVQVIDELVQGQGRPI